MSADTPTNPNFRMTRDVYIDARSKFILSKLSPEQTRTLAMMADARNGAMGLLGRWAADEPDFLKHLVDDTPDLERQRTSPDHLAAFLARFAAGEYEMKAQAMEDDLFTTLKAAINRTAENDGPSGGRVH